MTLITSHQNHKIKQIRALRQRKHRAAQGLFVVEGIRHVGEAVEAGAPLEYLLYAPDLLTSSYAHNLIQQISQTNIPTFTTTAEIFTSLTEKEHPQGILAVAHQNLSSLDQLNPINFLWGVALVSPQDPGNLGAILRTIDAAGADGLIVLENSVDIFHPTAVRASMGALFWKPVVYTSFKEFSSWVAANRYHVYASSTHGETDYTDAVYTSPAILLMGSEREGLTKDQSEICETVVRLPMKGKTTSLNLSVSAGILLYQMQRDLGETA